MENKDLRDKVKELVQEVEKTHRYSMSRVYGAYNEVFDKNEQPQACASCLIRKVNELKKWLAEQSDLEEDTTPASTLKTASQKTKQKASKK